MRPVSEIRADMADELERHRSIWKRLRRELSEARGVRHSPAKVEAIGRDWRLGVATGEIRRIHNLTKGQLAGLVERNGWARPWPGLKTLTAPQNTRYRKLRYGLKTGRVEAFAAVLRP